MDVRSATRQTLSVALRYGELSRSVYRSRVAARVARLASRIPAVDLYHSCLGAFPAIVYESLLELTGDDYGSRFPSGDHVAAGFGDPAPWEEDELDLVDFQWYFDVPSVKRILSSMPENAKSLVAMGTPTVATLAAPLVPDVQLLDISPRFQAGGHVPPWTDLRNVKVRTCDLDKPVSSITPADVVVMDPPWHIENYQAWLRTAVRACTVGGLLMVALPQPLTNRRARTELREVRRILRGIGRLTIKYGALAYVTPSFELPVLSADGLQFLRRWRRADLAIVTVEHTEVAWESPDVSKPTWSYRWMCGRVVRTWGELADDSEMPVIAPAGPHRHYRLASVGRNYLWSSEINLVTSRGRAAAVSNWGRLPQILDLIESDYSVDVAVKTALPEASDGDRKALIATLLTLLER